MDLLLRFSLCSALFVTAACGRTGLRDDPPRLRDAGPLADAPGPTPDAPTSVEVPLGRAQIEAMFVVDRSGSMELPIEAGGPSRWEALVAALAAVDEGVEHVAVGASLFPDEHLPDGDDRARYCATTEGVLLAPELGGLERLVAHLREGPRPRGGTPTAAALAATLAAVDPSLDARRAWVLVTDGAPNCAPDPFPSTCACSTVPAECDEDLTGLLCIDEDGTLAAIERAVERGIPVVVVGIDDPDRPDLSAVLDRMALVGGRPRPTGPHRYYSARSAEQLREALAAIGHELSSCTFVPAIGGGLGGVVRVAIGGIDVPPSAVDGWTPAALVPDAIQLHGEACTAAVGTGARVVAWIEPVDRSALREAGRGRELWER